MNEQLLTEIAMAVKAARRRQGLDQQELAMVAGVATRTVSRIENAHPTVRADGLLRVLDALGIQLRVQDLDAS
jgi:y4mF family transcriptional regulator